MASSSQHIDARDDVDLQNRLIAIAEQMGYDNARSQVSTKLGALVGKKVEVYEQETTIADVYASAVVARKAYLEADDALPPGQNPSRVTDEILVTAVTAVLGSLPVVE